VMVGVRVQRRQQHPQHDGKDRKRSSQSGC
jgi:hypothetical protein